MKTKMLILIFLLVLVFGTASVAGAKNLSYDNTASRPALFALAASWSPSVPAFPVDPISPDPIIEPPPVDYE
jgi:hypothetical protein